MTAREHQILVAGIGNAWMRDDGFGGHVAKALGERELPQAVTVLDFGTGGLDLAYEVMRGYYDALVLVPARPGRLVGLLVTLHSKDRPPAPPGKAADPK